MKKVVLGAKLLITVHGVYSGGHSVHPGPVSWDGAKSAC
jgi:hypothetical protein